MGINLKAKPFYLSDEDIKWVENTLANLTLDEKIGQVFVDMLWNNTEEEVVERIQKYGMGGFRYNNMSPADLYKQNKVIQETAPLAPIVTNSEGTPIAIRKMLKLRSRRLPHRAINDIAPLSPPTIITENNKIKPSIPNMIFSFFSQTVS